MRCKRKGNKMKKHQVIAAILLLFIPIPARATDIGLSPELKAQATVIRSERQGFWEKTLVVRFPQRRRILSTNDGMVDAMAAVNHAAHPLLWSRLNETIKEDHESAGKIYMTRMQQKISAGIGLRAGDISMMGTAADMDNLAIVTKTYGPFVVTALVTAGAKGNALRTGVDEGTYIEPDAASDEPKKIPEPKAGTINIIILCNARITDGGMARAIITATEAKTAALEDLKVPSTYTKGVQATGTGTDSMIVVSGTSRPLVTYPGGHSRIGELIGKAVYEAVVEALRKQNGFRKKND
jgi:adenosylcobinamide amidohydrolase